MAAADPTDQLIQQAADLRAAGRVPEAIEAYERLLAHAPDLPNSWYNLALLLRQARRYDDALAAYQQALDRGIAEPEEVHLNRGVIYADGLRREDDAERELQQALVLNPRYVPALLNLGNLHEDRGQRGDARALYERILAIDPHCVDALARHALLADGADGAEPLVARLRRALSTGRVGAADRATLGFALAHVLDRCGRYAEAFAASEQANHDSRASAPPPGAHYDRQAHEWHVSALMAAPVPLARPPARSNAQPAPIFICGMFRSGSTLVEQVLASHPRVTAGGELDLVPALARAERMPSPAGTAGADSARRQALADGYRAQLGTLFPHAEFVTDKRPDNYQHIGLIKALFPHARIVHTLRHPLDNCLSVYFLHLAHSKPYALDLRDTGHYYRQYRRLMAHWKSHFGDDILDFDYDAFVHSPRPALQRLLDFCGLEWDERCLEFHRLRNAVKTASVWQVRTPLYTRASGRWRHYKDQLAPLAADLQDLLPPAA
jgi:hypothetical protein